MEEARQTALAFVRAVSHKNITIEVFNVSECIAKGGKFLPDTLHKIYQLAQNDEDADVLNISFRIKPHKGKNDGKYCICISFIMIGGKVNPYGVKVQVSDLEFVECVTKLFQNCPNATFMDLIHDEDTELTYRDIVDYLNENREIFPNCW